MIYFLKFGASWVLPPGIFFLLFFFIALLLWRKSGARILAGVLFGLTLVFYALSTNMVADVFLHALEHRYEVPSTAELERADAIIMLGGGALGDLFDVDGKGVLCASPANRLLTAVRLQKKLDCPMIFSGGQVYADLETEARIAGRIAESLGVLEKDIILEAESKTTAENARNTAEILRARGYRYPLLVTSAFHMERSVMNFEKQGIAVIPYPADYYVSGNPQFHYNKLAPDANAFFMNVTVLREELRMIVTRYLE